MATRILHCSTILENYNLCLKERVAGFTKKVADEDDLVYFVVKINSDNSKDKQYYGKTVCGARAILKDITDFKPWEDAERYAQAFTLTDMEFSNPFPISFLREIGGTYWGVKYIQGSNAIKDDKAVQLLNQHFMDNKIDTMYQFSVKQNYQEETKEVEVSGGKIDIMGTFQTVKFINETDEDQGLETLVNNNFYSLFYHFKEKNTILIPHNRLFKTTTLRNMDSEIIKGISGIPDALLIRFNEDHKEKPIQVNLIEYECYGEAKVTSKQKFNYLNGHIIPQLMKFASNFSIVTASDIRENTISNWTHTIMDYISENSEVENKVTKWIMKLFPDIKERRIDLKLEKLIKRSFEDNVRVMLIIDELSKEQKETIKNIINSFKLDKFNSQDNYIQFKSYVVRLEQKIKISDNSAEFALSFEE